VLRSLGFAIISVLKPRPSPEYLRKRRYINSCITRFVLLGSSPYPDHPTGRITLAHSHASTRQSFTTSPLPNAYFH